jgi:hypothetical protein
MNNYDGAIFQFFDSQALTREKIENTLDLVPNDTALVPYATASEEEDPDPFSIFGFMTLEAAVEMNDQIADAISRSRETFASQYTKDSFGSWVKICN